MSILILDDGTPRPPPFVPPGADDAPAHGAHLDSLAAPHIQMPMSFAGGRLGVIDQDSLDEIIQNIAAIVATPQGYRTELPGFGLPSQVFLLGGVSEATVIRAITRWEERAEFVLSEDPVLLQQLVDLIMIQIQEAENG